MDQDERRARLEGLYATHAAAVRAYLRRRTDAATAGRQGVGIEDGGSTLAEALATLAERDREALLLISWDGLSPGQAAAVLGCSRPTFAMRLHRARKRLSAALLAVDQVDTQTLMEACNE